MCNKEACKADRKLVANTGTICRPQWGGGGPWLAQYAAASSEHLDLLLIEQSGTRKTT